MALAILVVASASYWYKWFRGDVGPWLATGIGTSLASALLVLVSSHKRHLTILALDTLLALGFLGTMRYWITGKPVLPGLLAVAVIFSVSVLLRIGRPDVSRDLDQDALAENTGMLELNLRNSTKNNEGESTRET